MSTKPTKPTAPPQALRSEPATFSARTEDWIAYQATTLPDYEDAVCDYVDTIASASGNDSRFWFDDLSAVKADTVMTYTGGLAATVSVGEYVQTRNGLRYTVAAAAATDNDIATAVGVKLYVAQSEDGTYNAKAFGALGDGVTDDTAALKKAIKAFRSIVIPRGTYIHDGSILIPSFATVRGAGVGLTILEVKASAGMDSWGVKFLACEWSSISDISFDGKLSRLTPPFSFSGGPFGSGVIVQNSKNIHIDRVSSVDWAKHCFDVTANAYTSPDENTYLTNGRSEYVWIDNCYARGAGDDNFTTHQSDYIQISNCRSESPSGSYIANNSNCYEIDDGSRRVKLINVFARGGVCGIQVKGHTGQPAPQDIMVIGAHIEDCNYGVDCYNTGRYGDGTDVESAAYSSTSLDLVLRDIHIRNPIEAHVTGEELPFAFRVRSYANVTIDNIHVIDAAGPFYLDSPFLILSGVRNVNVSNIHFTKCSGFDSGIYTTSTVRRAAINGVNMLKSTGLTSAAVAVRLADPASVLVDNVNVNFCTNVTTIRSNDRNFAIGTRRNSPFNIQTESTSSGGAGGTPTVAISSGWVEGVADLGAGEGIRWEMTCQLAGESTPTRVAAISSRKANGTDTSKTHGLFMEVRNAAGSMVDGLAIDPEGWVSPKLGNYANDGAASSAGVPVGGLYHTSGTVKVRLT